MHPKAWMHISEAPKGGKSCYTTSILGLKDAPMACKTINTITKIMDVETYRYCIFFNCPSCGTNGPASCAFPRSLAKKGATVNI